jgi:hypothetical protein
LATASARATERKLSSGELAWKWKGTTAMERRPSDGGSEMEREGWARALKAAAISAAWAGREAGYFSRQDSMMRSKAAGSAG